MGGWLDSIKELLIGKSGSFSQQNTMNPQQQQLHGQLLNGLGGAQSNGLDWITQILQGGDNAFAAFEDPYKRQFNQETIPGLAEQFAGMGSGGSQNSSAFQQSLGSAGADLSSKLASLRGNLQQQAIGHLQGFQNQGYQPTFQQSYTPATGGLVQGLATGIAPGVGDWLGNYLNKSNSGNQIAAGSAKV